MVERLNEGQSTPVFGENGLSMLLDKLNRAYYKGAIPMHSGVQISDNELDMILDSPDFPRYKDDMLEVLNLIRALSKDTARQLETIIKILDNGYTYTESKNRPVKKTVKESLEPDGGYIEVYNVNKDKIANEVNEAASEALSYVRSDEARPTWHWNIGEDEDNYYAIVLGFTSEDDVAMKWAYISKDSIMNEYDMDYMMPYDSETGDVWDSEILVDGYETWAATDYLFDDFKRYADQRNSEWDEFEDDLYSVDDEDDLEYESIRLKRESTNKRRPTSKKNK